MNNLAINYLPIGDLKPNPRNCRTHPKKQLHQIAASIREFGFNKGSKSQLFLKLWADYRKSL